MHSYPRFAVYIIVFCLAVFLGFYLLARARNMFPFIRPELLRRNIVTYLIGFCFFLAVGHLLPDFTNIINNFSLVTGFLLICLLVFLNVSIPYNIVLFLTEHPRFSRMEPVRHQVLIFFAIVLTSIIVNGLMNVSINGSDRWLIYSMAWSFYIGGFGAMVYLFLRNHDAARQKLLFQKELELERLNGLKTKAELDALHSRINPHFLYNALNSIADLTIMDGSKARGMTISLAELFRYSINYNASNYASVQQELELARTYLDIESIRFEDRLVVTVVADPSVSGLLIPKFTLQPLLENAVKHGLKRTGNRTEIRVEVLLEGEALVIRIADTGPPFPDDLKPGYGLKGVFDKLEMLFRENYSVRMQNVPEKYIELRFPRPIRNEPL